MEGEPSSFEENAKKIISNFTKAEKHNKENDPKFKHWVKTLCDPNTKLIQNLLNYFLDDLTDQKARENILKIFRKLYVLEEETVAPQILMNQDFPKAIVKYITSAKTENISDNSFYILTKFFNEKNFKSLINEQFIIAMYNGLSIVHEEDILNSIVEVLIEINSQYKNIEENIFLKIHKTNNNSRVLDEILLRVLNNAYDKEKEMKILNCINNLMDAENCCIFYESDLEIFIDIIIPKLQITNNEQNKICLLNSIDRATRFDEYYKKLYKVEEITELMEDYESREEQTEEVRKISKKIVTNITDHQNKNKK